MKHHIELWKRQLNEGTEEKGFLPRAVATTAPAAGTSLLPSGISRAGSFICFCAVYTEVWRRIAKICGDCHFSNVNWATSITEICRDDESMQKLRRRMSKSRLVKFPTSG